MRNLVFFINTRKTSFGKTMILRIEPPLPLISPKGKCYAHFLIDYGIEEHLMFVCFQDETGECWTWSNPEIRIQNNPTIGRICEKSKIG